MWYYQEKTDKLIIISVPMTTLIVLIGCILLQIVIIGFFYEAFQDGSFSEFLGYGWFNKGLKLFLLGLPVIFALLFYLLLPLIKTEINRRNKSVSVRKVAPFCYATKFGFDFIDAGIRSNVETVEGIRKSSLYFELKSGEKIDLFNDASASREQTLKLAAKADKYLQV